MRRAETLVDGLDDPEGVAFPAQGALGAPTNVALLVPALGLRGALLLHHPERWAADA